MARIYLSPPHIGPEERQLVLEAIDSNWIAPLGPHVDAFEAEVARVAQVEHAAALSSGTAALHLALLLLGVSRNDEVLVSSFTFAATANPVVYVGARPVFIDSSADTWNLSPELVAEELRECAKRGRLPKALITVDLYGQCADYDPILAACAEYGVPVIEDAAEALGATYKGRPAGSFGEMAAFSFNGNKIITTSGGGMLVSRNREYVERARFLATQARDAAPHYEHSTIGYNYRMSNLLAALGRAQLAKLEERIVTKRATNAFYREALGAVPGLSFPSEAPTGRSNGWLTCLLVDPKEFGASREDVRLRLEAMDIESRPLWKPMHLQPVFAGCRVRGGAVSADLFSKGLCLPSGSALTSGDRERVLEGVLSARK